MVEEYLLKKRTVSYVLEKECHSVHGLADHKGNVVAPYTVVEQIDAGNGWFRLIYSDMIGNPSIVHKPKFQDDTAIRVAAYAMFKGKPKQSWPLICDLDMRYHATPPN